ncbi:hypothetical protein D3C84_735980 [compost metagenome]
MREHLFCGIDNLLWRCLIGVMKDKGGKELHADQVSRLLQWLERFTDGKLVESARLIGMCRPARGNSGYPFLAL